MFFQSPRPFGQHSTSYRSMSNNIHSSSSMTNLQKPEPKSGRISAPPISFSSNYESSRFAPPKPPMNHTAINNTNFEQTRISKDSNSVEATKNMEENRSNIISSARMPTLGFKNNEKHRNTSLHNSIDSGVTSDQNLNNFQSEVRIPISKSNVFQVQRQNVSQQQPTSIHHIQPQEPKSEQISQNVSPYVKAYHSPIARNQGDCFRSDSTMPFAEYASKPAVIQSQLIPISSTGGYASTHGPIHEHGGFSEIRVSSSSQFNLSQVHFNERQQQQQKPITHQLERYRNYATLQHIASPKIGPLKRRTSDPNLIKINGDDLPADIAMFNVAKGVRAELEQDPKFRRKADILSSRVTAKSVIDSLSPSSLKEQPKQSPSLRQMENFFEQSVQQSHSVLDTKRSLPVPPTKLFNLERVRSIFRTSNTVSRESPPKASSLSMDTSVKQDRPFLGKPTKSLVEKHEPEREVTNAGLKEDMRTSGNISRQIVSTSQSTESAGNAGKLAEQKVYSFNETSKTNKQTNPSKFVGDKSGITTGTGRSLGMQKKEIIVSQEQPLISHEIALLGKDYDSHTTFVTPRRLNQPFPVNDAAFVSGSAKTRNVTGPPGILMKDGSSIRAVNDSAIKTPKKVAFQCDSDSKCFKKDELETSKSK